MKSLVLEKLKILVDKKVETLSNLIAMHETEEAWCTILTTDLPNPTGYGRIIRNSNHSLSRIVEEKDRLYLNSENIDYQNIFTIIDNNLVGLAIYYRDSLDNIDLVHIAVDEKYSSKGTQTDKFLVFKIIK